jgi:hypothetical protein
MEIEYVGIRDETRFNARGETTKVKILTFKVGPFGPFTETFPAEEFTDANVSARVQALRQQIERLPR